MKLSRSLGSGSKTRVRENERRNISPLVETIGISPEDAFRTLDSDFDGFVNKNDLKTFLVEVLRIQDEDITSPRIDRLFKLIDQFKRGLIQLGDFKRILEDDFDRGLNMTISGGKTLLGRSTFDWKVNAKQQIGLILSQRFSTVTASFDGNKALGLFYLTGKS